MAAAPVSKMTTSAKKTGQPPFNEVVKERSTDFCQWWEMKSGEEREGRRTERAVRLLSHRTSGQEMVFTSTPETPIPFPSSSVETIFSLPAFFRFGSPPRGFGGRAGGIFSPSSLFGALLIGQPRFIGQILILYRGRFRSHAQNVPLGRRVGWVGKLAPWKNQYCPPCSPSEFLLRRPDARHHVRKTPARRNHMVLRLRKNVVASGWK